MNASLTSQGALNMYIRSLKDIKNVFATIVVKFSSNHSNNFDIDYMNKTVNVCKLFHNPRYEPLLKLGYKIISKDVHLPQRCPVKKVVNF